MSLRSPGQRARLRAELLEDRVVPSFTSSVIFTDLADGKLDNPGSVATGDLNGDGKPDLAITNYGSSGGGTTVSVFFNDGNGGFAVTPDYNLDTGTIATSFVTIADMDGDSELDIVVLSAASGVNSKVTVFTNNGSGSGFTKVAPVDSGGMGGAWLAVGDVNADGKPDVVVANGGVFFVGATGNNIVVLTNDGTGVLSTAKTLALPVPGGAFGAGLPRGVVIADMNGDSKPDVVVGAANPSFGAESNGTVNTYLNTGTGTSVSFGSAIATDTGGLGMFGIATADFDGNGKPDVIVAHAGTTAIGTPGDGSVAVLLNSNNSDGKFQAANVFLANKRIFAVAVADFDGKNGVDFAAIEFPTRSDHGPLHVLLNVGTGKGFTADAKTTTDTGIIGPQFINTADFNGDSKPDIVVVGENNQGVTYQNVASAPSAPTGLTATPGNAHVALNWNAVSGATSYNVYRGTSSGSEVLIQSGVATNSFDNDTGLSNGTTYFYQVTAVNGGGESTRSSEVSATPQATPSVPTGLNATPGNAHVALSWNTVSGAATYNLYRGTTAGNAAIYQTGLTATAFDDVGLTNGTNYFYQVTATNVGGESTRSSEVSATPQATPSAPTGLNATPGNAHVALIWNAVSGAATYSLYRGTTAGNAAIYQTGLTATAFDDLGVTNGTSYFYQVTATNVGGESTRSSEVSATPQATPSAPSGLTATPGNAHVALIWNAVSGAATYSIYRGTTAGNAAIYQTGLTATAFDDVGLTNGTTYFYQVTATNVGGESTRSSEVSATPQATPSAPSGLTATPGNAHVALSWNAVSGAATYNLYRGTTTGNAAIYQTGLTGTAFDDVGLTNGTNYFYQVTATNVGGESTRSSEVSATPQATPSAPTGLNATPGNAHVALIWNAVSGAATYNLYRGTTAGNAAIYQTGLTGTAFDDVGLTNGTTYFYQVTATNVGGESTRSSEVSATPQATPSAPSGLTATPGNAHVALSWNAVSGAATYNLYRGTTTGNAAIYQTGLTGTAFDDVGLTNGTTYFYQVTATNVGGESSRSSEVSATPQATPSAPTGLTATPGNAHVALSWNAVSGAATYNLYRGTTAGNAAIYQTGLTATAFDDVGLTNGTTYFYQVTATNVGGESTRSSEVSATPQATPSAPTGLTATPGNAHVALSWNAVSGAATYNLYRGTSSGSEVLIQSGLTGTTFNNTGLTNGTTYFYQVTATNVGGQSTRSVEVSATPQAPPLLTNVAVGSDSGITSSLRVYSPSGQFLSSTNPFGPFDGGLRTSVADFNGDGTMDIAVGTGPGATAQVKILDGKTGATLFDNFPFEAFSGGVFVSAGDVTGDGVADLVVTPDLSGGPRVSVFRGGDFVRVANFFGIDDPNFRGGARAAAGDLNGDSIADLVVSAGFGGGPRISIYDGKSLASGQFVHLVPDFFLFEEGLRNGAYVAVGDVNGDGQADLIGGGGPGGGPRVLVVSGSQLLAGGALSAINAPLANFFAGDIENRGGIRVSAKNLDGDGFADIVVGSGAGAGSRVTGYFGKDLTEAFTFDAFSDNGGVYVG